MPQTVRLDRTPPSVKAPQHHRTDIEGLRALSVLMVMAYHAGVAQLPGGFVALDVFFVISGFLITQLLVAELRRRGTVRLRQFYARRAKRLLPALSVVLVAVALLTWLVLPRTRWAGTAQDILYSAVYAMNWRLAGQSVDYFQQDGAPSILQHFWSLAVEEQFYLVWPLLLIGAAAVAVRLRRGDPGPSLLVAMVLVGVPSLAWSVYYTAVSPGRAYFVTTTRMWELALGGTLAILAVHLHRLPRAVAVAAGWTGLAVVLGSAALFSSVTAYPGYWALLPALGTVAVIAAGFAAGRAGPVAVLGTAPMQVVGRMSYSLYLVHWPVLVLAAAVAGPLTVPQGVAVVAASAVPAYLLHRYVENPVRFSTTLFRDSAHVLRVAAVVTVVSATAGMGLLLGNWPPPPEGTPTGIAELAGAQNAGGVAGAAAPGAAVLRADPQGDPQGAPVDRVAAVTPDPLVASGDRVGCMQDQERGDVISCTYGRADSPVVVAVVGDSHANQWVPGLADVATARGWRLVEYTKAGCSFVDAPLATAQGQEYTSCQEWNANVRALLLGPGRPALVVTSADRRPLWLDGRSLIPPGGAPAADLRRNHDESIAGLRRDYQALTGAGIPVVVMRNTPDPETDVPECVSSKRETLTACAGDRTVMLRGGIDEQVDAAKGVGRVLVVDLNDAICPTPRCAAVIGNVLVYRDTNHLTATYVRSLVPRLTAALAGVLA